MDKSELFGERDPHSGGAARLVKRYAALVLLALTAGLVASSTLARKESAASAAPAQAAVTGAAGRAAAAPAAAQQPPATSRFNHNSAKHSQMQCDNCHARKADALRPVLPGHRACISCHIKEFTSTAFGICNNCHDGIKAVRPAVLAFPARQSFGLEFKKGSVDGHITHATVVGGERRSDCTGCHSIAGARATFPGHRQCYACHKAPDQFQAGEKVVDGSCGLCHTNSGDRTPFSAAGGPAYRYRFSHQEHVRQVGDCTECHKVLGGAVAVSQPRLSQHRGAGFASSCGACHNGRRAFGGEIEHNACARCHGRPMM
jgi:c(7)-type cytochrome triheme protein